MARRRYHPYGEERYVAGDQLTDFGYTGQRDVPGTGLMYYKARYYHPALGCFVSADTIVPEPGNPQALNRYAYVKNNPLRYVDPSGYYSKDEIMKAFGVPTWEDVLAFFQKGAGGLLENRWGWLEALRKGHDGDLILSAPWDGLSTSYKNAYKLHRNDEGQIMVGDIDHAYFAHHQTRYTLISERRIMPFSTRYSKMHRHLELEVFEYSGKDLEAIVLGIASIGVEVAGGATPVALTAQAILDFIGATGAAQSLGKVWYPKRNPQISTDDCLSVASALPVVGFPVNVVDVFAHAFGTRIIWAP